MYRKYNFMSQMIEPGEAMKDPIDTLLLAGNIPTWAMVDRTSSLYLKYYFL